MVWPWVGEQALTSRSACHEGVLSRAETILRSAVNPSSVLAEKKTCLLFASKKLKLFSLYRRRSKGLLKVENIFRLGQLLVDSSAVSLRLRESMYCSRPSARQVYSSVVR